MPDDAGVSNAMVARQLCMRAQEGVFSMLWKKVLLLHQLHHLFPADTDLSCKKCPSVKQLGHITCDVRIENALVENARDTHQGVLAVCNACEKITLPGARISSNSSP